MKTYRIYCESISYVYYDVEAEDEEQAHEIYYDLDGGLFIEEAGDWVLDSIVEVSNEK